MTFHENTHRRTRTGRRQEPMAGGILAIVSLLVLALAFFIFLGKEDVFAVLTGGPDVVSERPVSTSAYEGDVTRLPIKTARN